MNVVTKTERLDVRRSISRQIVASLNDIDANSHCAPWHRPSESIAPPHNIETGKPYGGVNLIALWTASDAKTFSSGLWGTYLQWQQKGLQVERGEMATTIVTYHALDSAHTVACPLPVFAAEQTDRIALDPVMPADAETQAARAEAFLFAIDAPIRQQGERAFYDQARDEITTPPRFAFQPSMQSTRDEAYYASLFHDIGRWSLAAMRTGPEFAARFGSRSFAAEELTAELIGAFLCAAFEIGNAPRPDYAAFVPAWRELMTADKHAVFVAAGTAARAVRYLGERVDHRLGRLVSSRAKKLDNSVLTPP